MWNSVCTALAAAGHDVIWAGDWEQDPGDDAILQTAHDQGRVLVTLDKGFGDDKVKVEELHEIVTTHLDQIEAILNEVPVWLQAFSLCLCG